MIQLLRFTLVGLLNTGLGYAVIFACMGWLGWNPFASNVAGYAVGMLVSFTLNRQFTFRSTGDARREGARFLLIFLLAYLANLIVLWLLVRWLQLDVVVSQVLAGVVYFGMSFVLNKYYVFADRSRSAAP